MIKSISIIGTLLTKESQQSIKGGKTDQPSCNNLSNWTIYNGNIRDRYCVHTQEPFYDLNLGRCSCRTKTKDF